MSTATPHPISDTMRNCIYLLNTYGRPLLDPTLRAEDPETSMEELHVDYLNTTKNKETDDNSRGN